jgi:hypothetical protein
MNIEVFNAICMSLTEEFNKTNIVNLLTNLSAYMQNMVSQPQVPQHQQNVSQLKADLILKLRGTRINDFSPLWKEHLKEIGFEGLYGYELADKIDGIFAQNKMTISVAHQEIANIHQRLSVLVTCINRLVSDLKTLNIGFEKLQDGRSEFEILIPRMAINQDIEQFADEVMEIKRIIDDFNELIIGSRPEIKLKTIASSDYSILLDIFPKVGVGLLTAISLIITTYQSILEIKRHHKELKAQGVPDNALKSVEDYANNKMADSISQGVNDLIKTYASNIEKGRKSELSIAINMSMNKLSNRIDSGYNFDVRFSDDQNDVEMDDRNEYEARQQIQDMLKNLKFMNLSGEKILSLPEKTE